MKKTDKSSLKAMVIRKKYLIAGIAGILALILLYIVAFRNHNGRPEQLTLYGNVDIRQVDLAFEVDGRIEKLVVEEGDMVEQGQLIGALNQELYQQSTLLAQARVNAQQAVLQKLQSGNRLEEIAQARAELAVADSQYNLQKAEFSRREELFKSGNISRQQYEDSKNALDTALARQQSAQQNLNLSEKGAREEDIAQAKSQLQAEQASLAIMKNRYARTQLFSPAKGVITARVLEPGSVVAASSIVYTLAVDDKPWIRSYVPEPLRGFIKQGMQVVITSDQPDGKTYHGQIGFISPVAEFTPKTVETTELRTQLVYRVRILVDDNDGNLHQGMPVTIVVAIPENP